MAKRKCFIEEVARFYPYRIGKKDEPFKCPFHAHDSPSMVVDSKTGDFECSGCGRAGPHDELISKLKSVTMANYCRHQLHY